MKTINICLSCDNNYVQHLGACISSVLNNKNEDEFIKAYVIDGGISKINKEKLLFFKSIFDCEIIFIQPKSSKLNICTMYKNDYITLPCYFRLLIPELINEKRIIYLDCDTIVLTSLDELFNLDFKDKYILGVVDVSSVEHARRLNIKNYINSGVMLMNCQKMKEEKIVEKFFNWIKFNKEKIEFHDQDVINSVLDEKINYIDLRYNVQVKRNNTNFFEKIKNPYILHFISPKKPWIFWKPIDYTMWEREYFVALKNTPWKNFILEYQTKEKFIKPFKYLYPRGQNKKILENLFSIKNSSNKKEKIIKLLGITLKTKRKKVEV